MANSILYPYLLNAHGKGCRRSAPTSGIAVPGALRAEIELQKLEVIEDTVTDGNCGIHAFGLGLAAAAAHHKPLYVSNQYKQFLKS